MDGWFLVVDLTPDRGGAGGSRREGRRSASGRGAELEALNLSLREEVRRREAAERALRKAEGSYRNLIDSSADGMIVASPEGIVRFVNPAAEALFHRPAKGLEGRAFGYPLVAPGESTELDILGGEQLAVAEMRVTTTEWEGESCLLLALRDVTERKQARDELNQYRRQLEQLVEERTASLREVNRELQEEAVRHGRTQAALQRSERLYHTTVDHLTDMVHVVDRDLHMLLFNAAFSRMCEGLQLSTEVMGRSVFEVFPFLPARVREEYERVFSSGQPLVTREANQVGGTEIITETRKIPVLDGDAVGRVITVLRDITEQKRAEDALKESEARYRHLFENIPIGVYRTTPDGEIVEANQSLCQLLGYSDAGSLSGVSVINTYVSTADRDRLKALLEQDGLIRNYEAELRRRDGTIIHTAIDARAFADDLGGVRYYEGTIQDISERKRAEEEREELVQTDKLMMLGTLVSGVAHEVNNPNNFIMLNVPVLEQAFRACMPVLEERFEEHGDFVIGKMRYSRIREALPRLLVGILDGSRRIKRIVDELRSFSRPEMAGSSEDVDISSMVDAAVSLTSNLIARSTTQFVVEKAADVPKVRGSFQRLEQVIINLVQNACQSLPDRSKGVRVGVGVDVERRVVVISVADEGAGVPADSIGRLTEPFFTTKKKTGGTGLGLAVSAKIVEEHGGTLDFVSSEGVGTTATVFLPVPDGELD